MFDLHVNLTSKLHQISANSKFRFTIGKDTRIEDTIKAHNGSVSEFTPTIKFGSYIELTLT